MRVNPVVAAQWSFPDAMARRSTSLLSMALVVALLATVAGCTRRGGETSPPGGTPPPDRKRAADLSDRLQQLLDDLVQGPDNIRSGLLLVEGPGFRWKGASGVASEATGAAMLPDDQFAIDSIAKTMTATIVMELVEEGRLALDDPIGRYLPRSLMDGLHVIDGRSYSGLVTVRHLLNHSSGIPDDWSCADFLDQIAGDLERRWIPEETIAHVKTNCEPEFPPD
jgi:CubicO group peptidase (beta-lactamase class C family)